MSIAQQVKTLIDTFGCTAYSLDMGYGVQTGGNQIEFSPALVLNIKRNSNNKIIYYEAHYPDNSYLVYKRGFITGKQSLKAYG